MTTNFPNAVDDALVQDSNYRFGPEDRQYIDEQIRALQAYSVANRGYTGTRGKIYLPVYGEVSTSSVTQTTILSFAMADESSVVLDAIVSHSRRTNVTKAGCWKRLACYRRTGGGAPTLVGAIQSGTDLETTPSDDVTFTVSGNTVRVSVTAADTDPRTWLGELRVQETRA